MKGDGNLIAFYFIALLTLLTHFGDHKIICIVFNDFKLKKYFPNHKVKFFSPPSSKEWNFCQVEIRIENVMYKNESFFTLMAFSSVFNSIFDSTSTLYIPLGCCCWDGLGCSLRRWPMVWWKYVNFLRFPYFSFSQKFFPQPRYECEC